MAKSKEFNLDALQALQELTLGTNHVERWQGTPQLLPYNVSTHAYNCAMLYMQLCCICAKPMDLQLLSALLCHDNMESLTGDLLAPAKDASPEFWDSIEEKVQEQWQTDTNMSVPLVKTFLPIEDDLQRLSVETQHLLKIIDMLEFLLHAQQEYRAGNRCGKVMSGLKYGGASLKRRLNAAQNEFDDDDPENAYILDIVACIRYYYNRQCSALSLPDDYYV